MNELLFADVENGQKFVHNGFAWSGGEHIIVKGDLLEDIWCDCESPRWNAESVDGLFIGHLCPDDIVEVS